MDFLDQPPTMWSRSCCDTYGTKGSIRVFSNRATIEASGLDWDHNFCLIYHRISHSNHLGTCKCSQMILEATNNWQGGILYPWKSWRVILPLCMSSCGLLGFLFYERFYAANPFIRLSIFGNCTAGVTYLCTFLHGVILWTLIFYLPLYYEAVKGFNSTQAGIAVFPETFTVAPASLIMGLIVSRTGRYQLGVWAGWLLTTLGTGLLCLLDVHTTNLSCILLNLVGGVGMGLLFSAMSFAIQASASAAGEDMGFAIAMFCFLRALGTVCLRLMKSSSTSILFYQYVLNSSRQSASP